MNKSTLAILTAALGVAAGILIEKRTSWFDHLMRGETDLEESSKLVEKLNKLKNKGKKSSPARQG